MKMADFVQSDATRPRLRSEQRDEVIGELMDALIAADVVDAGLREDLMKELIDREEHGSTGFGKGVAVPHVRHAGVDKMVAAIGVSQNGVEFHALDKAPVYCFVLLLSPQDEPDEHLQAMETIFANLQKEQFRRFLRQASTQADVMGLVQEADSEQLTG